MPRSAVRYPFVYRPNLSSLIWRSCLCWLVLICASAGHAQTLRFNTRSSLPAAPPTPYTYTVVAAGGTPPYAFTVDSGSLPSGLSLSSSGVITGTATGPGTDSFTLRVTDSVNNTVTKSFTLGFAESTPSFTTPANLPAGQVGIAYQTYISIIGGPIYPGCPYSLESGAFPPGFSDHLPVWNGYGLQDNLFYGIPTVAGTYNFTLRCTNPDQTSTSRAFTLTINPAASLSISTTSSEPLPGIVGAPYLFKAVAAGGRMPYSWQALTALPAGITLDADGTFRGTPTTTQSLSVNTQVTDATGATATKLLNFSMAEPVSTQIVTGSTLPRGTYGQPYGPVTFALGPTGTVPTFWRVVPGYSLPMGLSLNQATGTISGTPTYVYNWSFQIQACMGDTCSESDPVGTFSIAVGADPLSANGSSLFDAYVGQPYQTPPFLGFFNANAQVSLVSGTLPPGMQTRDTVLLGVPTQAGNYSFTLRITDSGSTLTAPFTLKVNPALPLAFSLPDALDGGYVGASQSQTLISYPFSGGISPRRFQITSGTLPAGLKLSTGTSSISPARISGTPTTVTPVQSLTIQLIDSTGATVDQTTSISVAALLDPLQITDPSSISATQGVPYSRTFSSSGGIPRIKWQIVGNLPAGLTFNNGTLSGTPTASGSFPLALTATDTTQPIDDGPQVVNKNIVLNIGSAPSITTASPLPNGTQGTAYNQTIAATGGTAPYAFIVTSGSLPNGLNLATDGSLTGTPTASGTFNFVVTVTDAGMLTSQKAFSLTVGGTLTITSGSTLQTGEVTVGYGVLLFASGGSGGYNNWQVTSGSLPPGLSLNQNTGGLSGTPTTAGSYLFTVTVNDSSSGSANKAFQLDIVPRVTLTTPSPLPPGVISRNYSLAFQATGGILPYSWSVTGGSLPPGLTLDSSTGQLSGQPTQTGTFNFTIRVSDDYLVPSSPQMESALKASARAASGSGPRLATSSGNYSLTISPALSISTSSLPGATAGSNYSTTLAATGGLSPYSNWTITNGALPAGLTLAPATGILSGTTNSTGTFNFTVGVTDADSVSTTKALSLQVSAGLSITTAPALPAGAVNASYSQTLAASGGTSPYSNWIVTTGALPGGLSLDAATGALAGTPTASGNFSFTVQVSDSASGNATKAFTLTINPALAISTSTLPGATAGVGYSTTLAATGGFPPYSAWTVISGALPTGLSLDASTGTISGTTNATGPFNVTVRVADSTAATATKALTLQVSAGLSITTAAALPAGAVNAGYSQTLTAAGGTAPYSSWTVTNGALPGGLSLDAATGALTGTPTASGNFSFTVQVSDNASTTASKAFTLTINPALAISTSTLPGATASTLYSTTLTATGGFPPYSAWTVISGALPTGLTLDASTGTISGTTTATGPFNITVRVADSTSATATKALTFQVSAGLSITTAASLPAGVVGANYSQTLTASGGTAPYSNWTVATGALPGGLSLDQSTGTLSGMPTASGNFSFTVQVSDNASGTATKAFTLTINPALAISTSTLPGATANVPYSTTLTATGGIAPYSAWTVISGALPAGLNLDSTTGTISGTTSATGSFNITVRVADSTAATVTKPLTLQVSAGLSITTAAALPTGAVNASYSQTLAASGGTSPYSNWIVISGTLPGGLSLDQSTGNLTGTPTASGAFSFTVQVSDSASATTTKAFTLTINPALAISTAALPGATAAVPYTTTLAASDGLPPYSNWTVVSGALPSGITLDPTTGILAGTTSSTGTFNVTISVQDSSNVSATRALSLVVSAGLSITTAATLPSGAVNTGYSQGLVASGGTPPYSNWTITSGTLPGGLALDPSSGILSGTPTANGSFDFTVQVSDSTAATASKAFSLVINSAISITTATALPGAVAGASYSATFTAAGGLPPYSNWTVVSGALPSGLTVDPATGSLTGTTNATGPFSFTVQVKDSSATTTTKAFTLSVSAGLSITTSATLDPAFQGASYSQTIAAAGGVPPYSFAVTGGALPAGLTLASNGTISGIVTNSGPFNFTVTVTDQSLATAQKTFSISVNSSLSITNSATLPSASLAVGYSVPLVAAGGSGTYSNWTLVTGTLPAGLSLNPATGVISGTPTSAGTSNFIVGVTDSASSTVSKALQLTVLDAVTIATPSPLPPGVVNRNYSLTFQAAGGQPPYSGWTISSGTLPAGLSLNQNTGQLSGKPVQSGTFTFTVRVLDALGNQQSAPQSASARKGGPRLAIGSAVFSLTINPVLSISTSTLPGATVGIPYSANFAATGGLPAYSNWTISAGTLPAGLSLSSSGVLSGTPTVPGSATITVQVSDSGSVTATRDYTLTVISGLNISTSALPGGTVFTTYQQTLQAAGGNPPYSNWRLISGRLPNLTLSPSSGILYGTPSSAGTYSFTVGVTDSQGTVATKALSIVIAPALTITSSAPLPAATLGVSYSQTLVAEGGAPPYSDWSVYQGSLPLGLSLNPATGQITGTPTSSGPFNFIVQVKDQEGRSSQKQLSIIVESGFSIVTSALNAATVGQAYTTKLAAAGGATPYTWQLASGATPAGITLASDGTLTGVPTAAGTYQFGVRATDASSKTALQQYSLVVTPLTLSIQTTSPLPQATIGTPYSTNFSAIGGTAPYLWTITAGVLPAGLSLAQDGTLAGTPASAGDLTFTVQVTDKSNATASRQFTLSVKVAALSITTASPLTPGTVGTAYSTTFQATGGTGTYTWTIASGTLPVGLSLSSAGVLSGTPGTAADSAFTVQVANGTNTTTKAFTLKINPAPLVILTTDPLASGTVGTLYSTSLQASGGTAPYQWSVVNGTLPPGISLTPAGLITGTPQISGSNSLTFQVTDSANNKVTKVLRLNVQPAPITIQTPAQLTSGTINQSYQQILFATGGNPPYTWTLLSGALPPGVSLNAQGSLTGTPTQSGTFTFTLQVADTGNLTASRAFTLKVNTQPITIDTGSPLPNATLNSFYSQSFTASGTTGSFRWSVISGSLPPGLNLDITGVLNGTPSSAGTYLFTVQIIDSAFASADRLYSLTVSGPSLVISTSSLPAGTVGSPYSQTLTATGGTAPYRNWTIIAGVLPPGLTLSPSGLLSGTPGLAGPAAPITVQVTDAANNRATRDFTLAVNGPELSITTTALPAGVIGTAYTQSLTATGGTPPYRWSIPAGQLPAGISLSTAGQLTGTPSATGVASFTVQVSDALNTAKTAALSLEVTASRLQISTGDLPGGTAGTPYVATLEASPATTGIRWSVVEGTLPAGLTLNSTTGRISGMPFATGTARFRAQVSAPGLAADNRQFSVAIQPSTGALTLALSPQLPSGTVNHAYATQIGAAGGTPPYTFSLTGGPLPAGLSLSADGRLDGVPTESGSFALTLVVTDDAGNTASQASGLVIDPDSNNGPTINSGPQLPLGGLQKPYSLALSVTGGVGPYTWSMIGGQLPAGLTFEPLVGVISGTPLEESNNRVTIQVTDSNGRTDTKVLQLPITPTGDPLTAVNVALPNGTAGLSYTAKLSAAGGQGPYTWQLQDGSIPTGLTLGPDGSITGTPLAVGTFTFTALVKDRNGYTALRTYTGVLSLPLSPAVTLNGIPDQPRTQQQFPLTVDLTSPYSLPISGRVILEFTPAATGVPTDPALQFNLGGRAATFQIPAGQTRAVFSSPLALQLGTIAGTVRLSVELNALNSTVPPANTPDRVLTLPAQAPTIMSAALERINGGFQLVVTGYSNTREITSARVRFNAAAGKSLSQTDFDLSVADVFQRYFTGADSQQSGGLFRFVQPFTVNDTSVIDSLTVTFSNRQGSSPEATARF